MEDEANRPMQNESSPDDARPFVSLAEALRDTGVFDGLSTSVSDAFTPSAKRISGSLAKDRWAECSAIPSMCPLEPPEYPELGDATIRVIIERAEAADAALERMQGMVDELRALNAQALEDAESARRESDRAHKVSLASVVVAALSLLVALASLLVSIFL